MAGLMLKRSLSFSSATRQLIKTPIQVHGIEGRYASALYSAAYKSKKLDTVDQDLQAVRKVYQDSAKFKEFILDPTLRPKKKKQAMLAVLDKVKVCKEAENFLVVLTENGRLNKFVAVVNSFESIMRAHRGEIFVEVTSAEPLSKKHEAALNEALQRFVKPNQKLRITMNVNSAIIGGLIVNIGDKYVDMSIASQVKKYEQALQSAI